MGTGTGLELFSKIWPHRFFDVGIAEQHAVTLAAGLAAGGFRPVVAIYSTFLQRAYDQILHDVCLQNLPVTFVIDRAGLVGEDGETTTVSDLLTCATSRILDYGARQRCRATAMLQTALTPGSDGNSFSRAKAQELAGDGDSDC